MNRSAAIGTAVYVALTAAIIGGTYAGFLKMVGPLTRTASGEPLVQQGPGVRASGKWTPVEIKREPPAAVVLAPAPHYAAVAKKAALGQLAERKEHKKRTVVARRRAPEQFREAEARQAFAFAPEPQRAFGPFGF